MAEIGIFGYDPRPGAPFIFAGQQSAHGHDAHRRHDRARRPRERAGTRALGIVGAAQIDRTGRVNSTYDADGRYLVGSGGANDILSAADEVVVTVTHSAQRLVERVPYVTCPGDRVGAIVTDRGVLERAPDGEFYLTRVQVTDGERISRRPCERAVQRTGWDLQVARGVVAEEPPHRRPGWSCCGATTRTTTSWASHTTTAGAAVVAPGLSGGTCVRREYQRRASDPRNAADVYDAATIQGWRDSGIWGEEILVDFALKHASSRPHDLAVVDSRGSVELARTRRSSRVPGSAAWSTWGSSPATSWRCNCRTGRSSSSPTSPASSPDCRC